MPRYMVSALTTAGSTTLPIISLYGATTVRVKIREIALFNTTTTAVSLKIVRVTTTGTQGTALTEMPLIPTITTGDLYRLTLGAAIGSGVVLKFEQTGLGIPATANNGIAVVVSTGTGQAVEASLVWEE
jgi:hypothetical protein